MPADLPDRNTRRHNGTPPTTFEEWCQLAEQFALDEWWYDAADTYERADAAAGRRCHLGALR
jgi:hypothetical protein